MKNAIAAPQTVLRRRLVLVAAVLATVMLIADTAAAGAAPIGTDGKIHACYKVRGKPKGQLRILLKGRRKCGRGERKVAFLAVAGTGITGQPGGGGQAGDNGAPGAQGNSGSAGAGGETLEAKVSTLSVKVGGLEDSLGTVKNEVGGLDGSLDGLEGNLGGLEGSLSGLENELGGLEGNLGDLESDLGGVADTLAGVDNAGLIEAIEAAPAVEPLCEEVTGLADGLDALNSGVGALSILGNNLLSLDTSSLPEPVGSFSCP